MTDDTRAALLELKIDLQKCMDESFDKVYNQMRTEFANFRTEMKEDSESTAEARKSCEKRFQALETWKAQKEIMNGHSTEERKQKWDKNLTYRVVVTSAFLAFLFDAIIKKIFG
jgi:hypothetical protein